MSEKMNGTNKKHQQAVDFTCKYLESINGFIDIKESTQKGIDIVTKYNGQQYYFQVVKSIQSSPYNAISFDKLETINNDIDHFFIVVVFEMNDGTKKIYVYNPYQLMSLKKNKLKIYFSIKSSNSNTDIINVLTKKMSDNEKKSVVERINQLNNINNQLIKL